MHGYTDSVAPCVAIACRQVLRMELVAPATFHGASRLVSDPSVTVTMLEEDIEAWLAHTASRDILKLVMLVRETCTFKCSPASCIPAIISIANLLFICLERCPNAVLPRLSFSRAVVNVHERAPLYFGERPIKMVADEFMGTIRCALAKVHRRP